jgi:hypothetical protein
VNDQPINADRVVQILSARNAALIAELTTELALTQEALERAQARIAELEGDKQ